MRELSRALLLDGESSTASCSTERAKLAQKFEIGSQCTNSLKTWVARYAEFAQDQPAAQY
jgi:hypothetical protein